MRKNSNVQYYVEGDDEKKLLNTLKTDMRCIVSGKVDKFNVIQNRFNSARIRTLKPNTVVILVYDTDVAKTDVLRQNIDFLKKQSAISDIICIPQIKNLEEELRYACQIHSICDLTHSVSKTDFKRDLIRCNNLNRRLQECRFDISKFWSRVPMGSFGEFGNGAFKIKL